MMDGKQRKKSNSRKVHQYKYDKVIRRPALNDYSSHPITKIPIINATIPTLLDGTRSLSPDVKETHGVDVDSGSATLNVESSGALCREKSVSTTTYGVDKTTPKYCQSLVREEPDGIRQTKPLWQQHVGYQAAHARFGLSPFGLLVTTARKAQHVPTYMVDGGKESCPQRSFGSIGNIVPAKRSLEYDEVDNMAVDKKKHCWNLEVPEESSLDRSIPVTTASATAPSETSCIGATSGIVFGVASTLKPNSAMTAPKLDAAGFSGLEQHLHLNTSEPRNLVVSGKSRSIRTFDDQVSSKQTTRSGTDTGRMLPSATVNLSDAVEEIKRLPLLDFQPLSCNHLSPSIPHDQASRVSIELQLANSLISDFISLKGCDTVQDFFSRMEDVFTNEAADMQVDHVLIHFSPEHHRRILRIHRNNEHAYAALNRVIRPLIKEKGICLVAIAQPVKKLLNNDNFN